MNGMIDGDLTLNAAIYQQDVCDVCLNCKHPKCLNTIRGCEAFRDAVRANTRKYNRGGERRADAGGGKDPAGVGRDVR